MPTDTSEKGLETRTINLLLESGWLSGENQDYKAASCVDLALLAAFLQDTQPETAQVLHLESDDNTRRQFLQRLHRQVRDRGIIDVLRKGIDHGAHSIRLFYGTPSPGNESAATLNTQNLCLDKGYDNPTGHRAVAAFGYRPHIRRIGEEKLDQSGKQTRRARRWVVERTLAWLSKCRAILVR